MAITPLAIVTGPARAALPHGLFSVVPVRTGTTDRWESGVAFESIGCPPDAPKGVGPFNCDPEEGEPNAVGLPKDLDEGGLVLGEAEPFLIYETYQCSPIGNTLSHAQDVAQARLEAREEMRVEQALSTGAFGQTPNFADTAAVTDLGAQPSPREAIGLLEQTLATEYGAQGLLHMSRFTATILLEEGVVKLNNGRLATLLGTPVVAGAGYAFEGVIATPAIFGYRSDIFNSSNRPGDLLDRDNNNLFGIAERSYLLGMEECGIWSVTFPIAGGGGGGTVDQEARDQIAALTTEVEGVTTDVDSLSTDVDTLTTDLGSLTTEVGTLTTTVAGKADASHTHAAGDVDSGTLAAARIPALAVSKVTGLQAALDSKGQVDAVTAGTGIAVDNTDPTNPTISAAE